MRLVPYQGETRRQALQAATFRPFRTPVRVLNKSHFVIILRSMSNRPKSDVDAAL
jgi:hypothetical protein